MMPGADARSGTRRSGRTCRGSRARRACGSPRPRRCTKRTQGQADRDVDVARSAPAATSTLPTGGHQAAPVREQDEQEERDERSGCRAGRSDRRCRCRSRAGTRRTSRTTFWPPAGDQPAAAGQQDGPTRTRIAMTIHIVRIVLLMLGWKTMSGSDPGRAPGRVDTTSRAPGTRGVPLMKQTGYGHGSPAAPPLGNGGTRMTATMSRTMIAPMNRNQRWDSPRPDVGWGSGAGASAVPGGHVLLARHARSTHRSAARRRARFPLSRSGSDRSIE